MHTRHKYTAVAFGVFLVLVLQKFNYPVTVFRYFIPMFAAFLSALGVYNYFFLKNINNYNFWVWLRPLMFSLSILGIYISVPNDFFRILTALAGAAMLALFELAFEKFSDNANINETLLTSFGIFLALTSLNFYFPGYSYFYVFLSFCATCLISRSFLEFIPQSKQVKALIALSLGFFTSQFFWALSFLPLHFSALTLILFSLFYFILILSYYYLFNILSGQKIKFHLWLIIICIFAVVVSTPWSIL